MIKIKVISLCITLLFHSTLWAFHPTPQDSAHHFVNELKEEGLLRITDQPAINIFLEQTCGNELALNLAIEQKEKLFCEIVTKSDTCQEIPINDLRNCEHKNNALENGIDIIVGCAKGLFNSVKELLSFLWEAAKFIWDNVTDWDKASKSAESVAAFSQSIKLYLYTEYDKAYETASFPRGLNAAQEVASGIFKFLGSKISEILEDQYTKFGCLNPEAKTRKVCHVIGDLVLPPAAFFAFLKRGVRAADEFPSLNKAFDGMNGSSKLSDYKVRLGLAEEYLGKQLTQAQQEAVVRAHLVGVGEVGLDGTLAKVGNYTPAQLRRKNELLKQAGLNKNEVRILMENSIVGIGPDEFARIPVYQATKNGPITPDMRPEYESVRAPLREGRLPQDPYVSFVAPDGTRLPARLESYSPHTGESILVLTDGRRIALASEQLSSVRHSSTAREAFQGANSLRIPVHAEANYEVVRRSLRSGEVPADPFVSYLSPSGHRLAAKIEQFDSSTGRVLIRLDNGQTQILQGEDLLSLRSSSTAREAFSTVQTRREIIPTSSDPRIAPIRDSINKGVTPSDPYVSVVASDGSRIAARIDHINPQTGKVTLSYVDGTTDVIAGARLETIRLSDTSKDAFNANSLRANPTPSSSAHGNSKANFRRQNIYNEDYKLPRNLDKIENDFIRVRDEVFPKFDVKKTQPSGEYFSTGYWWNHLSTSDANLPKQGWKLHVSAKPENMADVARDVLPELQKHNIPHKVVGNFKDYVKKAGSTSSQQGKFITVYPRTTEEAKIYGRLIKEIMEKRGYKSDDFLNIPNEIEFAPGVFGRYGRLVGGDLQRPDGSIIRGTENHLLTPNGDIIPDPRGLENPSFVELLNL